MPRFPAQGPRRPSDPSLLTLRVRVSRSFNVAVSLVRRPLRTASQCRLSIPALIDTTLMGRGEFMRTFNVLQEGVNSLASGWSASVPRSPVSCPLVLPSSLLRPLLLVPPHLLMLWMSTVTGLSPRL